MKTFIYICLLVIGLVLPAGAQVPIQSYRGQVSVKQNRIEREGNSLRLDLTISVCGLSVGRYQTLSLMPMLRSDRDSVVMAPVVLNGANKQKMYDRTLVFEDKKAADGDAYTVIKNTPECPNVLSIRLRMFVMAHLHNYPTPQPISTRRSSSMAGMG